MWSDGSGKPISGTSFTVEASQKTEMQGRKIAIAPVLGVARSVLLMNT